MTDDRLLRNLGALAREQGEAERARWDERWDRLAAGTLTPEEEAELKALAEASPEAREAYEAFRPLGADFQARVVSAIQDEIQTEIQTERKGGALPEPEPPPPPLPFPVRRVKVWVGLAAAVAGLFFVPWIFVLRKQAVLPPLPGYEIARVEIPSDYRGSGPQTASPGSLLTFTVRPQAAVTDEVIPRGFLACGGGDLQPWPLKTLKVTEKGIMTLQGTLGKDLQPESSCEIWIIAARPGKVPGDLQTELRAGRTGNADWQAASTHLDVRLPP
jgi:hypothetical protein